MTAADSCVKPITAIENKVELPLLVAWRQSERCAKRPFRIPTLLGYIAGFQFIHLLAPTLN